MEEEGEGGEVRDGSSHHHYHHDIPGEVAAAAQQLQNGGGGRGVGGGKGVWRRERSVEEKKAKYWKIARSSCKSLFPNKGDLGVFSIADNNLHGCNHVKICLTSELVTAPILPFSLPLLPSEIL